MPLAAGAARLSDIYIDTKSSAYLKVFAAALLKSRHDILLTPSFLSPSL